MVSNIRDFVIPLLTALIPSLITFFFTNRHWRKVRFAEELRKYGFSQGSTRPITKRELRNIREHATEIDLMYVSGKHFLDSHADTIQAALNRGATVKLLCASPASQFLRDIERLETTTMDSSGKPIRQQGTRIADEVRANATLFDSPNYHVRFFDSEYRLPLIIAYFDVPGQTEPRVKTWTTVTLPPQVSTTSFILRGTSDEADGVDAQDRLDFVHMTTDHFDAVWAHAVPPSDYLEYASQYSSEYQLDVTDSEREAAYIHWYHRFTQARERDRATPVDARVLIEIAAQHPLKDGVAPGNEFTARLNRGIELYHQLDADGLTPSIYVPGSIHQDTTGNTDSVSLSTAGENYLKEHGIPAERIYSDRANQQYKGDSGVYNSADECFVASRIMNDEGYGRLYCVCSPTQVGRKVLFYVEFGVWPYVSTAPSTDMYHDYLHEYFGQVPYLLYKDHNWQGISSQVATGLRASRKPDHLLNPQELPSFFN